MIAWADAQATGGHNTRQRCLELQREKDRGKLGCAGHVARSGAKSYNSGENSFACRGITMTHVEIKSRVGADGVLTISLPLGPGEANREVRVTVEPAVPSPPSLPLNPEQWRQFVESMAGCISDPTFERPEQGQYERRNEDIP